MYIKFLILILLTVLGFVLGYNPQDINFTIYITSIFFAVSALFIFLIEPYTEELSTKSVSGLAIGIVCSAILYLMVQELISFSPIPENYTTYVKIISLIILVYSGITLGIKKGGETEQRLSGKFSNKKSPYRVMILDTSVIIDGRIADVAEVGFINGEIIVPKFIIKELQYIADSGEPIKRVRGRRGLDILKRMQQDISNVSIKITGHDFPKIKEADLKLVELAKKIRGIIITNDHNLNKVADLQGVKVLNLNELSNALKPIVLPGEKINILIAKEGKEEKQGIGYLEDGTMVVVDDAREYIGDQLDVTVTSILQTPTGRMVFSKIRSEDHDEVADMHG